MSKLDVAIWAFLAGFAYQALIVPVVDRASGALYDATKRLILRRRQP